MVVVAVEKHLPHAAKLEYGEHGPSIQAFLISNAFIRFLIGGRGSGKTTALAEDITGHIWQNAGAKAIIARETETSQADSTIETMWRFFEGLGPLYSPGGPGLFRSWNNGRTFRIPSKLAVERMQQDCQHMTTRAEIAHWIQTKGDALCGYIEFRGLPSADKGKFRGMECSYFAIVEADQVAEKQFELALACLRWKGTDPETCDEKGFIRDRCVVLDSNPPSPYHWIAKKEEEEDAKPEEERRLRFWHISTYENEHNLPENYIRDTILGPYAKKPAMIERMLWGRYAMAYDGDAVFYNFEPAIHRGDELPWVPGAYLIRGWDFGTCNAVTWLMYWTASHQVNGKQVIDEYLHAMAEQYIEGSDTDRQARDAVRYTRLEFSFPEGHPSVGQEYWNDRGMCAGLLDFCDPAGDASNYSISHNSKGQSTKNNVDILRTHGVEPSTLLWQRGIATGIALINRFLAKRDSRGRPCFMIDGKNCPKLLAALGGGYRYPKEKESGFGGEEPLKGLAHQDFDFSHICDSFRYPALNVLKLMKEEFETTKKPNFSAQRRRNPNPDKRR